jgi:hypothetical protein
MALYKIRRHPSRVENSLPPWIHFSKKHKGIGYFEVPAGARGQRRALRNQGGIFSMERSGA